jgi:hypothetical protein
MLKKIIICTLLLVFVISMPLSASTQNNTSLEKKLESIEIMIYGAPSPGGILDRTDRLEEHVYGESYMGSIFQRVDVMYSHVTETTEFVPSMITKINAIEWMITKSITNAPLLARISQMEKLLGINADLLSPLDERMNELGKVTFVGGQLEVVPAILTKDSLIKVTTITPINGKRNSAGDIIDVIVSQDVFIGSVLIIPKGAKGTGKILKAQAPKSFGRDAKLQISIETVQCVSGNPISTIIGEEAKKETLSMTKAAGASVAGIVLLGPVGIIGGAFISGKNIDIPVGTEFYVQTATDADLFGVTVK